MFLLWAGVMCLPLTASGTGIQLSADFVIDCLCDSPRGESFLLPSPASLLRNERDRSWQPPHGAVPGGPRPSSAIPGLSLVATGAAPAGAASRGGGMLSAARRVQAYWPSRAEIRKATWFSGAVEEAGPSVGHALLPPLPSRPCAPV
ncbi:unnamed protein product [Rangifer tarandus platyrhynchus]|uniref:Uncharacterized protein n=1 Tax=Rangifer tarandus platyrhynchus TaxID=3082113 RepID=A0AC59Z5I5_RANTA